MRQEDTPLGEALRPSQLSPSPLPLMWQLYPGRRYRGSDSSFWRIVYHIEASVRRSWAPGQVPCAALLPIAPCLASQFPPCLHQKLKKKRKQKGNLQLQMFKGLDWSKARNE